MISVLKINPRVNSTPLSTFDLVLSAKKLTNFNDILLLYIRDGYTEYAMSYK